MKKDSFPVRAGTRETEKQIKELRGSLQNDIGKIDKKSFKDNMGKDDWESIKSLKKNENVAVIMSDKTNKICILDKSLAQEKQDDLTNTNSFEPLGKDPSKKITASLNNILSEIFCCTDIPTYYFNILKTQHAEAPQLYQLSKDHKPLWPNCKVRAVMPIRNSAIEKIDILVSKILTQYSPYLTYRIQNTEKVIQSLKNCKLKEGEFIFSLDIEAMFDNIPTCQKALDVIKNFMEKHKEHINFFGFKLQHIIQLIQFIFNNNYVENQGKYYRQTNGIGTGGHSSVMIGDIIINYTYTMAIENTQNVHNIENPPIVNTISENTTTDISITPSEITAPSNNSPINNLRKLTLFVDDSLGLWKASKEEFNIFLENINSIWETLNFIPTFEDEERQIIFLDVIIKIDENLEVQHEHFVKPTSSHRYLHFESHSPMNVKINIIRTEANRIIRNCSKIEYIKNHLEKLKTAFINSGYPTNLVDRIMLPEWQKAELGLYGHKLIEKMLEDRKKKEKRKEEEKDKEKDKDTFVIKLPYVTESFTRKMKSNIKALGINAKVVIKPGRNLKSHVASKYKKPCECTSCKFNIPCTTRNYIYQADCLHCGEIYIGASHRPGNKRLLEYESSLRLPNQNSRTTLGRHKAEKHEEEKNELESNFKFKIIDRGMDSLESFLKEGLHINNKSPHINSKFNNGFIM